MVIGWVERQSSRQQEHLQNRTRTSLRTIDIMTYSFEPFLKHLGTNWYDDDQLLQRLLTHFAASAARDAGPALRDWGALCAGTLRDLAEESARPENRPYLRQFDPYNRRVDEIVLPASTTRALQIVEGEHRLGAVRGDPHVFTAQWYLYFQNSEAGVSCSLACTDGMVRALERLGDRPIHADVVRQVRESSAERYTHGAQFVTEIQGGSDAGANLLEARRVGERWTLHGQKWFCSNINADYFLVTGRPEGAEPGGRGVALFLVPAYSDENRRIRNGYTIDRLKDKLGTCELATAEVTFAGAEAHPVGPLDRGLANVTSLVLVTSRVACIGVAAAFLRRAERIATAYADFRRVFNRKLAEFPLVRETLDEIRAAGERSLASLLELTRMWRVADQSGSETSTEALDFRYLLSLAKPVLTREATILIHEAIMLLGGNGVEERFSPLPRLWRDAIVMETWEGSHNVLFTQALRDMMRHEVDPAAFVRRVAGQVRPDLARELSGILGSGADPEATIALARFAPKLVHAFGESALAR
jgi:alkylation response protein AidB-like acyl-CoA dehydrogenase